MQAESAKNHNQHNQQNEIPKDCSLLRKFDLEAAKRGELLTSINNPKYEYILKSCSTKWQDGDENVESVVVQIADRAIGFDYDVQDSGILRMLPLCWIEGKPVYKGDVLWRKDKASGKIAQVVVNGLSEYDVSYLDFVGGGEVGLDFAFSTLHWEKPKVKVQKVQKEGWMNIYPSTEYSTFPCENSAIYRTKKIADDCASSNRIDCVKVQWEVQE